MTTTREGDFESILDDDSLDESSPELDALAALSEHLDDDSAESDESRIKVLLERGKDQGYLTVDQLTEVLPDNITESEAFDGIAQMFEDMSIKIVEQAPDNTDLKDANSEELSIDAQAIAAADALVGKTMDPVRMYMREMGTVPLLTREGEIVIAKRIEDGMRASMAILSGYPGVVEQIIAAYEEQLDEGDLGLIISGFLDPEDKIPDMSRVAEAKSSGNYQEDENEDKRGLDDAEAHARFKQIVKLHKKRQQLLAKGADSQTKALAKTNNELAEVFSSLKLIPAQMDSLLDFVKADMQQIREQERTIRKLMVDRCHMPKNDFLKGFVGHETEVDWVDELIAADVPYAEKLKVNSI